MSRTKARKDIARKKKINRRAYRNLKSVIENFAPNNGESEEEANARLAKYTKKLPFLRRAAKLG